MFKLIDSNSNNKYTNSELNPVPSLYLFSDRHVLRALTSDQSTRAPTRSAMFGCARLCASVPNTSAVPFWILPETRKRIRTCSWPVPLLEWVLATRWSINQSIILTFLLFLGCPFVSRSVLSDQFPGQVLLRPGLHQRTCPDPPRAFCGLHCASGLFVHHFCGSSTAFGSQPTFGFQIIGTVYIDLYRAFSSPYHDFFTSIYFLFPLISVHFLIR